MPTETPMESNMSEAIAPRRALPIVLAAVVGGLVLAGTGALWAHYGTTVFFEMIRTGIVGCFG
jgi:hypothetical protein